ncbi:hypothetical protein PPERSA_07376 [Pseudocohnilembus persalinus]|uniref:Uncharacterized protein n=1 Tax=Pseudocohnilembus persalinus TaxID=266149 RepID=A0A0V0Q9H8_PSEPJ|nr:hypothetical protein PPERSA_07376 [Pseudocohnilembus persalinus]|eukprot:KRW98878.1 hypothetical protein PPERSA_07376 [Pseudocohnilembus persalinus]
MSKEIDKNNNEFDQNFFMSPLHSPSNQFLNTERKKTFKIDFLPKNDIQNDNQYNPEIDSSQESNTNQQKNNEVYKHSYQDIQDLNNITKQDQKNINNSQDNSKSTDNNNFQQSYDKQFSNISNGNNNNQKQYQQFNTQNTIMDESNNNTKKQGFLTQRNTGSNQNIIASVLKNSKYARTQRSPKSLKKEVKFKNNSFEEAELKKQQNMLLHQLTKVELEEYYLKEPPVPVTGKSYDSKKIPKLPEYRFDDPVPLIEDSQQSIDIIDPENNEDDLILYQYLQKGKFNNPQTQNSCSNSFKNNNSFNNNNNSIQKNCLKLEQTLKEKQKNQCINLDIKNTQKNSNSPENLNNNNNNDQINQQQDQINNEIYQHYNEQFLLEKDMLQNQIELNIEKYMEEEKPNVQKKDEIPQ